MKRYISASEMPTLAVGNIVRFDYLSKRAVESGEGATPRQGRVEKVLKTAVILDCGPNAANGRQYSTFSAICGCVETGTPGVIGGVEVND